MTLSQLLALKIADWLLVNGGKLPRPSYMVFDHVAGQGFYLRRISFHD